jgi:hypothetical protein
MFDPTGKVLLIESMSAYHDVNGVRGNGGQDFIEVIGFCGSSKSLKPFHAQSTSLRVSFHDD